METLEKELLAKYAPLDSDLQKTWDEHTQFEKRVKKLEKKPVLNPVEEIELKTLKVQKLEGKTKLVQMLDKYKHAEK